MPRIRTITTAKEIKIFVGGDDLTKEINDLVAKGHSVHEKGVKTFITHSEVIDTTKEGSEQYTWDKPGNRVLHNKIQHTIKNGVHTTEIIGQSYRSF